MELMGSQTLRTLQQIKQKEKELQRTQQACVEELNRLRRGVISGELSTSDEFLDFLVLTNDDPDLINKKYAAITRINESLKKHTGGVLVEEHSPYNQVVESGGMFGESKYREVGLYCLSVGKNRQRGFEVFKEQKEDSEEIRWLCYRLDDVISVTSEGGTNHSIHKTPFMSFETGRVGFLEESRSKPLDLTERLEETGGYFVQLYLVGENVLAEAEAIYQEYAKLQKKGLYPDQLLIRKGSAPPLLRGKEVEEYFACYGRLLDLLQRNKGTWLL